MKKFLLALTLFATVACISSFAQKKKDETKYPFQEAQESYRNVQIYKILDQKDVYIVMYPKQNLTVGSVTIPKKWYKKNPRKLRLRMLPKGMNAYMSVFTKGGEFDYVMLTVPTNRSHGVWGVSDGSYNVTDADKETLAIDF